LCVTLGCVALGCVGTAAAVGFNGAGAAPKAFFDLVFAAAAAAAADDDDDDDGAPPPATVALATVAGSPTAAFPPAPTAATFPAAPTAAAGRDVDGARAATTDAAEVVFALAAADVGAFAVAAPLAVAAAKEGLGAGDASAGAVRAADGVVAVGTRWLCSLIQWVGLEHCRFTASGEWNAAEDAVTALSRLSNSRCLCRLKSSESIMQDAPMCGLCAHSTTYSPKVDTAPRQPTSMWEGAQWAPVDKSCSCAREDLDESDESDE
jgi:hypothetical protein